MSEQYSWSYKDIEDQIKQVNKYDLVREHLPYLQILADNKTVLTKNLTLVRVLKISGRDNSNLSFDEQREFSNIRANLFSFVPEGTRLGFYTFRNRLPEAEDKAELFQNKYAQNIAEQWDVQFQDSYSSEIYLVIHRRFPALIKNPENYQIGLNAARKDIGAYVDQVKTLLQKFGVSELENKSGNELFRFYSYLINSAHFNSKAKDNLFTAFSFSDMDFNQSSGLIRLRNDKSQKFAKIIGVRVNNSHSDELVFRLLQAVNHEFNIIQQVKTYSKEKNRSYFRVKRETNEQLPRFAAIQSRTVELTMAAERIEAGETNYLDYSCYIKVLAESEEKLRDAVAEIQNILANEGISAVTETIGVYVTFFALLPDNEGLLEHLSTSIRSRIDLQNAADFISLYSAKEGFKKSPFGNSPVVNFKSLNNSNYGFTFHKDDIDDRAVGHTMVIGQTGTGKSTLMAFLLMNCLKYQDIKILAFDSLQGLKLPITTFDGKYITVGKDFDLKLNPMTLPDSFSSRNFQKNFISMLAGGIEEKESAIIDEVLRQNYQLSEEDRSLKNLRLAFELEGFDPQSERLTLASRLKKWVDDSDENSLYARFFNNDHDNLNFANNIAAFDMGDVLKDKDLLPPVAFYIFHKFNQVIDSNPSPHIFFIDEMQKYLESKDFNPHIIRTIKESRKRNGIFIGCMQEASTLVESPNGDEIIENIATLIIFPNSQARREHYVDKLNLTDSEFDFIKNHPNPRHVLIKKKDGHSVIVDADLSRLGRYLKLFSSKDTDRKLADSLMMQNQESWIDNFLEEVQ